MSDIVQEIKAALTIDQVVGDYVRLKKAGRVYKALCPFHKEKSPSFVITPEKGLAYCFGCHTGGDMFEFIQKVENVDFPESVRILAKKSGLESKLSSFKPSQKSKLTPLFDLTREVSEEYYKYFKTLPETHEAKKYLKKRGVEASSIENFSIGFAPDGWDFVKKYAEKKKLSEHEMVLSGLLVRGDNDRVYDRFRNRIMFPLTNTQGTVIGFSGRTLAKEEKAKYVNSSDSPIFSKKATLFGLNLAKQAIREMDYIMLVEGQFDVVLCHQIGIKNVVASSGTAFTAEHLNLIRHFTSNIAFAFDADQAGVTAAKKAVELALSQDFTVKVIIFPVKKDPADIISEKGKNGIVEILTNAKNASEFYFETLPSNIDIQTPIGKKQCIDVFVSLYQSMKSPVDKHYLLEFLEKKLYIPQEEMKIEMERLASKTIRRVAQERVVPQAVVKPKLVEYIMAFMLRYPVCFDHDESMQKMVENFSENWRNLYKDCKDEYNLSGFNESENTLLKIPSIQKTDIPKLSVFLDDQYPFDITEEEILSELSMLMKRLKSAYKKKRLKAMTIDMKIAEANGDEEAIKKLEVEQMKLLTL